VAVRVSDAPGLRVTVVLLRVIPVTLTSPVSSPPLLPFPDVRSTAAAISAMIAMAATMIAIIFFCSISFTYLEHPLGLSV
jgi:hypothetical protein